MATIDEGILQSVINSNFKVMAEILSSAQAQAGAISANAMAISVQDMISHQRMTNAYREAFLAESLMTRAGPDIAEAVAAKKLSEADLARSMGELGNLVATLQQTIKGAQTTPPVTVAPPAAGA